MSNFQATEGDMSLINSLTYRPYQPSEIQVFKAKLLDTKVTTNNRHWTEGFHQNAVNRNLWHGVPVVVNHAEETLKDANLVIGRVFKAEYNANDGETIGHFYVPNNLGIAKHATESIGAGLYKAVSIGAIHKGETVVNGVTVIPGHPEDRIVHLALVSHPGCQTCGIVKECLDETEIAIEQIELTTTVKACSCKDQPVDMATEQIKELGTVTANELKAEYIRLQAQLLGTQISRPAYEQIANNMPVMQLRALVRDLKAAASQRITNNTPPESTLDDGQDLLKQIENFKRIRGH